MTGAEQGPTHVQDEARRARTLWRNERTSGAAPLAGLARAELHRRGDHDVLGDHGVGTLKVLPHVSAASHRASTTAGPPPPTARSRSVAAAFRGSVSHRQSLTPRALPPSRRGHTRMCFVPQRRTRGKLPHALRAAATLSRTLPHCAPPPRSPAPPPRRHALASRHSLSTLRTPTQFENKVIRVMSMDHICDADGEYAGDVLAGADGEYAAPTDSTCTPATRAAAL